MNPKPRLPIPTAMLTIATLVCAGAPSAFPAPQSNPSSSIEDINAIGHRTVVKAPNFYSMDKEKELGKQLVQEVERSSRLLDDPVVAEYVNRIGQTIAQNSDARFPIVTRVIASDEVNGGWTTLNASR